VLLGDAGYWHQQQMERIVDREDVPFAVELRRRVS
jgi:hypothetical protein